MKESNFRKVAEGAQELGVSRSYAYKVMRTLNEELRTKGYLVVSGRISRKYFMDRVCYGAGERKEEEN